MSRLRHVNIDIPDYLGLSVDRYIPNRCRYTAPSLPLAKAVTEGDRNTTNNLCHSGVDLNEADPTTTGTALHYAAGAGSLVAVEELLSHGSNINVVDEDRSSALMVEAFAGHADMVRLLLTKGAKVNKQGHRGYSALHCAAGYGIVPWPDRDEKFAEEQEEAHEISHLIVKLLLDAGADISAVEIEGNTPLHLAVEMGHAKSIALLLEAGADAYAVNAYAMPPMHLCLHNDVLMGIFFENERPLPRTGPAAFALLYNVANESCYPIEIYGDESEEGFEDNDVEEPLGQRPYDYRDPYERRQERRLIERFQWLLDHGVDINARDTAHGEDNGCILHYATRASLYNPGEISRGWLFSSGADVTIKDGRGRKILHMMFGRDEEMGYDFGIADVRKIIELDPDFDSDDIFGRSALWYATLVPETKSWGYKFMGIREIIDLLLQSGARPNRSDYTGHTALHNALLMQSPHIVKALIEAGADLKAVNARGLTTAYLAVRKPQEDLLPYLSDHGVKFDDVYESGWTLLHLAASNGDSECLEFLLKKRVDINTATDHGITPLHTAVAAAQTRKHSKQSEDDWISAVGFLLTQGANVMAPTQGRYGEPFQWPYVEVTEDEFWLWAWETRESLSESASTSPPLPLPPSCHPDIGGQTPLHWAAGATRGYSSIVQLLLEHGANVNARDASGATPLHRAAEASRFDAIRTLLARGGDPHAVDDSNRSSLEPLLQVAGVILADLLDLFKKHGVNEGLLQQIEEKNRAVTE